QHGNRAGGLDQRLGGDAVGEHAGGRCLGEVPQRGAKRSGGFRGVAPPGYAAAPGRDSVVIRVLSSHSALIAVAAITWTPAPMARSSTSNVGWWMSSSWAEPGVRTPSRAKEPGTDSRYQAKSSPPRLCGVPTTA